MAASSLPLLFLLLIAAIATTSARPCKTLFFFTSTSFYPIPQNPNPNPNPNPNSNPRYLTLFFTSTSNFNPIPNPNPNPNPHFNTFFNNPIPFETPLHLNQQIEEEVEETRSLSSSSSAVAIPSSIRDRTKEIISVVVALLLGMCCGVLTAATMYLIWSLFVPNRFHFDDNDDESHDFDTKRMGEYVAIPAKLIDQDVANDDDLKKPANGNVNKEVV